ncbi:exonuclease V (RecBCD complex), beta subunit [Wigglesworthia glossinidia endosymbiont of Glossina morsitans morsitans (Yale colony)]|uniref:RecBCD enzyme subunit RecB n=1 Tax=Wigglesworthia glossinidia endosymbiont of Glossina morsitans morsitans (Yale colony) TaxID=1142511 RepID=H6Q549_WIGGL|nr:exodeoxyribonuclease V subunit beta [Wigglesworthia glossinidia]AFA41332.1 exonuclease V (RecBCD complex), beta subunit [Wigglesworthia glossinidia endosymbiont of Glossina morsitans morsitans (Yale colony)]
MKKHEILNPITFPIQNTCLIEASAGTGKTYSIIIFYLRLLLGLNQSLFLSGLNIKEILVVTYTEAAKNQLKNRIRQEIFHLKLACINYDIRHPLIQEIKDLKTAILRLISAEKQIDEASIFTIHGFCHRMLNLNLFESGYTLNNSLLEDEFILYQKIFENFWHEHFSILSVDIIRIIFNLWKTPQSLLKDALPFIKGDIPIILDSIDYMQSIENFYYIHVNKINQLKKIWKKIKNKILCKIDFKIFSDKKYKKLDMYIKNIDTWSIKRTQDLHIPVEFEKIKFYLNTINSCYMKIFHIIFFKKLNHAYSYIKKFKQLIFIQVIIIIRKKIKKEKYAQEKLEFDDLLKLLKSALYKSYHLAEVIRHYYPVAMIDEFQDTNKIQYKIFFKIYHRQNMCALILIGDPKQAIYGFRGADIFTYIQIKKKIKICYSLKKNWRSSAGMINAVNCLFQQISNPFIFKYIKYNRIESTQYNYTLNFIKKNQVQPSLEFLHCPYKNMNLKDYQNYMANQYAIKIKNLIHLAQKEHTFFTKKNTICNLTASDITVLVRNRNEANFMQEACDKLSIPNAYLSDSNSIFHTREAQEVLQILEGILYAENSDFLRKSLSTRLLGFNIKQIYKRKATSKYYEYYQKFLFYRDMWKKYGIKLMLNRFITFEIFKFKHIYYGVNKKSINNILHIAEILQEISKNITSKLSLLLWISNQINLPETQNTNYKIPVENNQKIIKIMTIFKAKGLEFPIVFLPFLLNFRKKDYVLFHNKNTHQLILDLNKNLRNKKLTEQERLSEDLRLTYVALTRSIYHCSVGISVLFKGNNKNRFNQTHLTPIGYLVQKRKEGDFDFLKKNLQNLSTISNGDIMINSILMQSKKLSINPVINFNQLKDISWNRNVVNSWKIISYSDFKKDPSFTLKNLSLIVKNKNNNFSPHELPRGKKFGKFVHKIFELIDFQKPLNMNLIKDNLIKYEIDVSLSENIMQWINSILHIPLNNQELFLATISSSKKLTELKFFLSINSKINAKKFNFLIKKYDSISQKCSNIKNIDGVIGMLTGAIDLIFLWKKKYYFIDYKSNWLGSNDESYSLNSMEKEMVKYRYDLQYQMYTLALHRYLKNRLKKYEYNQHFGGIYYLFLRGISKKSFKNQHGIYFLKPNFKLVNSIDNLFLIKK